MPKLSEGWTWLFNSKKWHYFRKGRSLCGKWALLGHPELEADASSPDNCKACVAKRVQERERRIDGGSPASSA